MELANWGPDLVIGIMFALAGYATRRIPFHLGITGTDAWAHDLYVKVLREAKGGIPKKLRGFFFDANFEYPWLLHWILASVPAGWLDRHKNKISPLAAAAATGFCYGAGIWVGTLINSPDIDPRWVGLTAVGVYLVTPMTYNAWSGVHNLSERPLAALLTSAAGVGAALASSGAGAVGLTLWILSSSLVPLSSKFGVQVLALVFPLAGALAGDRFLLATPLIGVAGATLISGGHYLRILKGHLSKMQFYRECLQWRHVAVVRRNQGMAATFGRFVDALRQLEIGSALRELAYNPVFRAVLYFPFILLVIPLTPKASASSVISSLLWLAAGSFAIGVAVGTIRPLRFIGEGDRYVYYGGIIPSCLALGVLCQTPGLALAVGGIAAFALLVGAVELCVRARRASEGGQDAGLEDVLDVIRSLEAQRVLAIPTTYEMAVRLHTEKDVVAWANPKEQEWDAWKRLYPKYYPYPLEDLSRGREIYGFDVVLVSKEYTDSQHLAELDLNLAYDFDGWRLVHENETATVWQFDADDGTGIKRSL